MPSKSPHSQSATSGSQSGTSGSGSGSPKANFKHSLPQNIHSTYFRDIKQRVSNTIQGSPNKRRSGTHRYQGEDHQVCVDLVEACRFLETAPVDATPSLSNNGQARRKSRQATPTHHASSKPPPSPLTTSPPPPLVALSQGRTSDGLHGLNHFPPQKDVFNGPAQAFLESSPEAFSSATAWQRWSESRSKFFEHASQLAAEVFTFACVDETIVSVSPSTPLGAATSSSPHPQGSSSSRNSPSTPFRRSPRPDYESRILELQAKYVKIGASSFLQVDKAALVHVWRSGKAAGRYASAWQRCWQALFEHRIMGIHCPLSVLFSIQGISVSVTALPPVYVDRVPPMQNIFTPFFDAENVSLHKRSNKPPSTENQQGCHSPMLSHMLLRLFTVLHIPQDDSLLDQYGDCHLYHGIDGRLYLLLIGPLISHSTPTLQTTANPNFSPVRHELLREMFLDASAAQNGSKGGGSGGSMADLTSFRGVHKYILHRAIPRALDNAASLLPQGSVDSRRPEVLLRDGFLGMMLHDHGVNMSYLYHAYEYCMKMAAARTPSTQKTPKRREGNGPTLPPDDDYVAGAPAQDTTTLQQQRNQSLRGRGFTSTPSTVVGGEDDGLTRAIYQGEYYRLLASVCCMEMIARSVKSLAKLDMLGGFTTTADFRTSTTVRLDMVNRVARLAASRDQDFLLDHVLPMMQAKFSCPDTFQIGWETISTGSILKTLSLHLGGEYGVNEGRFKQFAPFAQKKAILMFPVVAIDAMLNKDERRVHQGVAQLWEDANRAVGRNVEAEQSHLLKDALLASSASILSPLHAAFVMRAVLFSITTKTHRSHIFAYTNYVDASLVKKGWPIATVAEVALIGCEAEDRRPADGCDQWKSMLFDLSRLASAAASRNDSSHPMKDDLRLLSLLLVHLSMQLLRAKKHGATTCARRAVEQITSIPHVDFVFDAHVAQLLKALEDSTAEFDGSALKDFFHGVVEAVVSSLRRWNRMTNAAKYLQRVLGALVGKQMAEESPDAVRIAQLAFSTHATLHGSHDGRTLHSLYTLCLLGLSSLKSAKPSITHGVNNLRKVIQKHQTLSPPLQISFGRTNTVQTLLVKVKDVLEECEADAVTIQSIKAALFHADRYRNAVLLIQSAGRGFHRRQLLQKNVHITTPFLLPPRPSSMVYFDGQQPISLGQAANLGISLEDDTTRSVFRQNIPLDAQSDVSSVTGSFMSGSNAATTSRSTRFSNSGGGARSQHGSNPPTGRGHYNSLAASMTGGMDSIANEGLSFLGSPNRAYAPPSSESPLEAAGRGFSIGSFSSDPMPHPSNTSGGGQLLRPIPRDGGGEAPEAAPRLPFAAPPKHLIHTVMRMVGAGAGGGDPLHTPSSNHSPDWQVPELSTPPLSTPPSYASEHRGRMVPNAWNFDMPYEPDLASPGSAGAPPNAQRVSPPPGFQHHYPPQHDDSAPHPPRAQSSMGITAQLSRSQEPLTHAVGGMLTSEMQHTIEDLFAMCDKDGDGCATVRECVDGVAKLHWMPVDDLRQLFTSVATKQKRSGGITGFLFGKQKEVLGVDDFREALMKAGVLA